MAAYLVSMQFTDQYGNPGGFGRHIADDFIPPPPDQEVLDDLDELLAELMVAASQVPPGYTVMITGWSRMSDY